MVVEIGARKKMQEIVSDISGRLVVVVKGSSDNCMDVKILEEVVKPLYFTHA